ncbi:hypothetical protein C1H46_041949 [Malus baccata]|uniref:Uncharacterized protein n=1 Tax=Malus baccata TaxID=106549 RepID=A0A540KE55_MALBA|nr:hypothetical protein C1H46_041949 [Malus baccata]
MNSHQQIQTDHLPKFWAISVSILTSESSPWIRVWCTLTTSFKEQNAHVASVKNIVESHADFLMSGKELSKLVAFVKGTQFDLVLQVGTLQSRFDAEFLLALMCSVKFKEWIVVLATLLRRSWSNECRSDHVKINRQLIDTGEEGIHLLKGLDDEH